MVESRNPNPKLSGKYLDSLLETHESCVGRATTDISTAGVEGISTDQYYAQQYDQYYR